MQKIQKSTVLIAFLLVHLIPLMVNNRYFQKVVSIIKPRQVLKSSPYEFNFLRQRILDYCYAIILWLSRRVLIHSSQCEPEEFT